MSRESLRRGCSGLPMPRRRTFASPILGFAHSMLPSLRHPWLRSAAYAGSQGDGQLLTPAAVSDWGFIFHA